MKATGIVRRIDDLGRVVIPKEIRRTLRIREGDPLEIFTDREGEVILKKYSPIGELSDFASQYAESIHKASGHITCITDRDTVIAVSGASKKEFLEKSLSQDLEKIIEDKNPFLAKSPDERIVSIVADENPDKKYFSQVITPIISEGDPIGAVILLSTDPSVRMGEVETKLAQSAAGFLGKQMEQ
ncbi:MAG: stage V sporulation protein T [Clostridia bacterium]|nr:stage V sporulation protein T [Clostridia bacterium]